MSYSEALSVSETSINAMSINVYSEQIEETNQKRLSSFDFFPQPIFILDPKLNLLETNQQGKQAIKRHWVSLNGSRLHFNSSENDKYVKRVSQRLRTLAKADAEASALSERFILRTIDAVYRAYSISIESKESQNLVLQIQGDINCTDDKMRTLRQVFGLSPSETRIIKMMVAGMKPKEIAFEAGISLNTVRSHLRTLYAKMQVRDYNDALTLAVRLLV